MWHAEKILKEKQAAQRAAKIQHRLLKVKARALRAEIERGQGLKQAKDARSAPVPPAQSDEIGDLFFNKFDLW